MGGEHFEADVEDTASMDVMLAAVEEVDGLDDLSEIEDTVFSLRYGLLDEALVAEDAPPVPDDVSSALEQTARHMRQVFAEMDRSIAAVIAGLDGPCAPSLDDAMRDSRFEREAGSVAEVAGEELGCR